MIAVSPAAYGYVRGGAYDALYASILGPFFLTILLMFVSGLTLQERPGAKKRYESGNHWESFKAYTERTSMNNELLSSPTSTQHQVIAS